MEQKQHLESVMDQRINLLTKVVNKRKRKAEDSIETSAEISLACLNAEKMKVKVSYILYFYGACKVFRCVKLEGA